VAARQREVDRAEILEGGSTRLLGHPSEAGTLAMTEMGQNQ
jgi:hypothetical protein